MSNEYKDWQLDEIHELRKQLAELKTMYVEWNKRAISAEVKLAECERERNELSSSNNINIIALDKVFQQRTSQLATVTRERDYWKGVAESECDARKEMSDRLDQCERDRDDRLADAKHYFEWLGEVQKKFEAVTKERDELLAICASVVENGIGFSDVKAMKAVLAKLGAEKEEL